MESEDDQPDTDLIRERVRSGEYFVAARQAYDLTYHDPMVDRYWYLIITSIALGSLLCTLIAILMFLPLKAPVPFVFSSQDVVEDLPMIKPIGQPGEDANLVVKRFLITNYVRMREEYLVEQLDRAQNAIKSQSTDEVFAEYQSFMNPRNTESPVKLYERHSVRKIEVVDVRFTPGEPQTAEFTFDAVVNGRGERRVTRQVANIAFRFKEITVDQKTANVSPHEFQVTGYNVRTLKE